MYFHKKPMDSLVNFLKYIWVDFFVQFTADIFGKLICTIAHVSVSYR